MNLKLDQPHPRSVSHNRTKKESKKKEKFGAPTCKTNP